LAGNLLRGSARTWVWLACVAGLLFPFAFYYYTSAPGIGMGDPALLVESAYWLAMRTHPARHNFAILIGKLFLQLPGYNPARALNLASVFTGATAILLFGILLLRVCRSKLVALACTGILMVSHSMWWHSTIGESYAVNAVLVVGALWLLFAPGPLRDWRLVLLFLVGALALFNHLQLGIILVGATVSLLVAMVSRFRDRGQPPAGAIRKVRGIVALGAMCTLAFVIGLIPWLIVLRQDSLRFGWAKTIFRLRGAKWRQLMFESDASEALTNVLYLVFEQFPGPLLLAVPVGLVILARRYEVKKSLGFFAMLALNTGFFALYETWDRYAFLLPTFIMFAFAGALAVDTLWGRLQGGGARRAARVALVALMSFSLLFPSWFYARLAEWGTEPGFWSRRYGSAYHGNVVDFAEYLANPNKRHWNDAEEYANLLFEALPKGAVYIDDDSRTYYPVQYFRRYFHKRPDLKVYLVNSWGFSNWGITRKGFTNLLRHAWRTHGNLYLPSLRDPFRLRLHSMRLGSAKPAFEIITLDERRYIYRLLTARDLANPNRDTSSDVQVR
jgi:hypothetical protein